jgi:hypothetical protein
MAANMNRRTESKDHESPKQEFGVSEESPQVVTVISVQQGAG